MPTKTSEIADKWFAVSVSDYVLDVVPGTPIQFRASNLWIYGNVAGGVRALFGSLIILPL